MEREHVEGEYFFDDDGKMTGYWRREAGCLVEASFLTHEQIAALWEAFRHGDGGGEG